MISRLAMLAKRAIEAAWLNAPAYDLATLAAEALESAQMLQSPESAEETARLRASMQEIRHLHTDSPMGPCPVCVDGDALGRDEDPTVPWPCPTAVLAGAVEVEPESATVPGFFRPGRTYTQNLPYRAPEDRPNFQCVGIGQHPTKGGLRAFGFEQPGVGRPWASSAMSTVSWADGWIELKEWTPDRLTRTFAPTQTLREGEAAAADFFQPGHTYADTSHSTDWKFRVDTVTTHPEDGERTALGWRHFRGTWEPYAYGEDDWDIQEHVGHTDMAEDVPTLKVFRASHESIVMGLYTTAEAAREHCEAQERRDQPTAELDWIEDEEDGVAELVATVDGEEKPTGYVVTALEVSSAYDPDGDE